MCCEKYLILLFCGVHILTEIRSIFTRRLTVVQIFVVMFLQASKVTLQTLWIKSRVLSSLSQSLGQFKYRSLFSSFLVFGSYILKMIKVMFIHTCCFLRLNIPYLVSRNYLFPYPPLLVNLFGQFFSFFDNFFW